MGAEQNHSTEAQHRPDGEVTQLIFPAITGTAFQDQRPHVPELVLGREIQRMEVDLGTLIQRRDIPSKEGPFTVAPEYKVSYPGAVTRALEEIFAEYNAAFGPLVRANQEWHTDYQHAIAQDGTPLNRWVQVDMIGLDDEFLQRAQSMPPDRVREAVQHGIFEVENSLAMYGLLGHMFAPVAGSVRPHEGGTIHDGQTKFAREFRASLDYLRAQKGMPVALLAVTEAKYEAMKASEFGRGPDEKLSDDDVLRISGFDTLWGPDQFRQYLAQTGGECGHLLYARSSDPVAKLKDPVVTVEHPLLSNPDMRRLIKAHAITLNIDAPNGDPEARINDTKGYLPPMGMAHPAQSEGDLFDPAFAAHLSKGKPYSQYAGQRLTEPFATYLKTAHTDPEEVAAGARMVRAKPMVGTYGCYGHIRGHLSDKHTRQEMRRQMKTRGRYVVQPELVMPEVVDSRTGNSYQYIDRVFFAMNGRGPVFMGGFRSLMPTDSHEAHQGRNHGSEYTVWAEIL